MRQLIVCVLVGLCGMASTQAIPPVLQAGPELEAFMDGVMSTMLNEDHVPGAVCSIVKDGQVIFAKGYGESDMDKRTPVDPATTEFEVASVSKLFTGTAVMQLVEQGKLDLDADVNQYLKSMQVPDTYPQPITLKHLLTHTAGFSEHSLGMGTREADKAIPLAEFMRDTLPPRVRPPGEVMAYSNQGVALAGLVVQEVSGQPFAEYVQQHILAPLGMERSNFSRNETVSAGLFEPYQFRGGRYVRKPVNYMQNTPAGALLSTGMDMTRFMMAHLNGGEHNGARILQPETAARMHTQQFTHDPRLPGVCVSFLEDFTGTRRAIYHDGYLRGYASLCYLLPEENVGIFLSNNGDSTPMQGSVIRPFMKRYFPAEEAPTAAEAAPDFVDRMAPYVGFYVATRHSSHTLEKLGTFIQQLYVAVGNDGTVRLSGFPPRVYKEVEPYLFKHIEDEKPLLFLPPRDGLPAAALLGAWAFEKLPWWGTFPVQAGYLGVVLVVLMAAFVLMPLAAVRSWWRPAIAPRLQAPRTAALLWLTTLAQLIFLVGLLVTMTTADTYEFIFGVPATMLVLLGVGQVGIVLTLACAALFPGVWRRGVWCARRRVFYSVVVLALLALIPFMAYWNLIGFDV